MNSSPPAPVSLITGTTHGIGRVLATRLVEAGHRVLMLCRHRPAAELLRQTLLAKMPGAQIEVVDCDLASLASVRAAVQQVQLLTSRIDRFINNAGTVSLRQQFSIDGFELTFATNHLGPFLLTESLRALVPATGRIIQVASVAHLRGSLNLGNVIDRQARYRSVAAYAQSKLANVLYTLALARRLEGSGVTVNCVHPGIVYSHLLPWWIKAPKRLITPVTFDNERGAASTLKLALENGCALWHGAYVDEHGQHATPSILARDEALQEALWSASMAWTMRHRD